MLSTTPSARVDAVQPLDGVTQPVPGGLAVADHH